MPMTSHRSRGFTLVETLVAVLVIGAALVGNYLLFARTLQQHQHGVHQLRAVAIARGTASALAAARIAERADPVACDAGDAVACTALARGEILTTLWRDHAAAMLPAALLAVQRHPDGRLDIELAWREPLSPLLSHHRLSVAP